MDYYHFFLSRYLPLCFVYYRVLVKQRKCTRGARNQVKSNKINSVPLVDCRNKTHAIHTSRTSIKFYSSIYIDCVAPRRFPNKIEKHIKTGGACNATEFPKIYYLRVVLFRNVSTKTRQRETNNVRIGSDARAHRAQSAFSRRHSNWRC